MQCRCPHRFGLICVSAILHQPSCSSLYILYISHANDMHMPSRVKKGLSGRGRGRPPKNIKDDEENGNEKGVKTTKTSEKVVTGKKRGRPTGGSKKVAKKIKTSPKKSKRVSSDMESHHSDSDSEKKFLRRFYTEVDHL
uniref:SWIM-type domain-containing protein n=1 Tax=Heterorhabditis bacteriophora TaxID=37862 RepID=A0A1I7WNZ8_HETBA